MLVFEYYAVGYLFFINYENKVTLPNTNIVKHKRKNVFESKSINSCSEIDVWLAWLL